MERVLMSVLAGFSYLATVSGRAAETPPVGAPAQPGLMVREFIFEKAPFPSCHASTIVETKDGLAAAWFGGTKEGATDVGIWSARREGDRWTEPVEVANGVESPEKRQACWNPVLFQPKDAPLMLFYKVGFNPDTWWGALRTSNDGGKTWSDERKLPKGFAGPIKNKPVQLPSGEIFCPSSSEDHGWRVHFERTADLGATWIKTESLNDGKTIGAIQPSILFHPGGKLQALGRTRGQGKLWELWSEDAGQTWSEMKLIDLPNPNSGTDAVTLSDGRHLLVYNHTAKGRSPLNVAVSRDGKEWQAALVLEDAPGEYSYPAVIQTRDGMVHITFTWKRIKIVHAVVDPKKLETRPIVNGEWPK